MGDNEVVLSSDEELDPIDKDGQIVGSNCGVEFARPPKGIPSDGTIIRRAEMYQDYMKQIPIPSLHGSLVPFTSWQGLAKSLKQLYSQPLHYLTNVRLKQWDQMRIGSHDEYQPLDTIIHPVKAEAIIWLMEEVHRLTSSHHHIAKLWVSDPMHDAFVDTIIPQI
ncbi:hypothetical protein GIB67_033537 [Kingdonia uniflora]|uniref:Protein RDM1 n=1 Tax=Kingdonia uniflora TaxID=39325 RepID=A0A7J7L6A4_9MAGN|nr:hypothetical protein GIB67_033537 [Kingdonia uniflora]